MGQDLSPDERRRKCTDLYRALPQDERDLLDTTVRRAGERQAQRAGFSEAQDGIWKAETTKRADRIREEMLLRGWPKEGAVGVEHAPIVTRKARRSEGKDASIRERDGTPWDVSGEEVA